MMEPGTGGRDQASSIHRFVSWGVGEEEVRKDVVGERIGNHYFHPTNDGKQVTSVASR